MKNPVINLKSILPRGRDPEKGYADSRFSPSFIDVGLLQSRACILASSYKKGRSVPSRFVEDVKLLIHRHVRHVMDIHYDREEMRFIIITRDKLGTYEYSFGVRKEWFGKP